jgi:hypothetical protein
MARQLSSPWQGDKGSNPSPSSGESANHRSLSGGLLTDGHIGTMSWHEDLQRALSDDEVERRRLSKSLLPHVRAFYANYFDPEQHAPFYRRSSRQ